MDIFESWLVNNTILKYGMVTPEEPENTIGAFDGAIKINAPILICVQSLDDENLVCFSYKNISKITNGTGYVQTLTLSQVENLKVKNTKYNVLSFEKALKHINGQVPVLINIFNDGVVGKMESNILKELKNYKGEFAVMSTNPYVLEWFKNNANDVLRGIKSGKFNDKYYGSIKTQKLTKLKFNKICEPDFIVYNFEDLPNKYVNKWNVLPIIAYGVTNESEYLSVVKHCDNVICDGFIPEI